ncbi:hypothetical protein [Pyrodictium abyssi]|uniref:Uncharacterized protein n=1 Tax=Pyrodictium abyssi TaxID=54256 RepID=A0ABN6ZQV9_9CREN|nr:hypothetical protein PABY_21510 [Pyrodictium abyssi]
MVEVLLRRGLSRDVIAGMVWLLLRSAGCMRPREIAEALRAMGVDVGRGKVQDTLVEYTGRLWKRVQRRGHVVYCAEERV